MINQRIETVVNFIREARDEADGLEEHILSFIAFLFMGICCITFAFLFCMLAFTFPKVCIPLYLGIFVLWQGYKRL